MLTIKINYINGTFEIKDVVSLDDVCLDGVESIKVIRNERG